jgi:dihydrodipicolinate synthase/N-acetylneuraminate lyase
MLSAKDLGGLMAMMPAFATDDANDIRATATVDVARLRHGLDRMIRDGADVIATTGSFGECHTLLPDEFRTLANECVAVVNKRVPLFVGVTSVNAREAVEKIRHVDGSGADGILLGVPYYFPSTVENAVRFYRDIGELFPKLNIMIYHNPALHHVTLPVAAFAEITKNPAVIAMKDSHRTTEEFVELQKLIRDKMGVFVFQGQYATYAGLGACGLWSIDAWMGPWPYFALRDAVKRGDLEAAKAITLDIVPPGQPPANLSWRETASKIGIRMAGYVDPGPLRPPFLEIPPEVTERMRQHVERWKGVCAKYRLPQAAE